MLGHLIPPLSTDPLEVTVCDRWPTNEDRITEPQIRLCSLEGTQAVQGREKIRAEHLEGVMNPAI